MSTETVVISDLKEQVEVIKLEIIRKKILRLDSSLDQLFLDYLLITYHDALVQAPSAVSNPVQPHSGGTGCVGSGDGEDSHGN